MSRDKKLTDKEKAAMDDALRDASLTDAELERLAEGVDESGEVVMPVEDGEDLITAAALAMEFVDGLETTAPVDRPEGDDAVAGFDALLRKLETLRSDISTLQRGVVGVFAAQLLTFRGKVVELKSRISTEMVERLRMKFFKDFIETTFVDIVDSEFSALEKDLVDKIVEQTQERFKEFALRVRESEVSLRSTIVEQQDVVRSFMKSLEEETAAQRQELAEKQMAVQEIERQITAMEARRTIEPPPPGYFASGQPFASLKGRLPMPVPGEIVPQFGTSRHPRLGTITENTGIDIQAPMGALVRTVSDAQVGMVTWLRGFGNTLILDHQDGHYSVYAHLDEVHVAQGNWLRAGEVIGTVGDTGSLEGPRLHFEIWQKRTTQDPESWLTKTPYP